MTRSHDLLLSATDRRRPSLLAVGVAVGALVLGAIFVLGVVVPAVFWAISLALPILLLVIGGRLIADNRGAAGRSIARVGGWAAVAVGGFWLLDRLNIFDMASFLFVRLPILLLMIAGAVYVGGRVFGRRR